MVLFEIFFFVFDIWAYKISVAYRNWLPTMTRPNAHAALCIITMQD